MLLLDQNISRKILTDLTSAFPGSLHVIDLGLEAASDSTIWEHAKSQGLAIVSKDADFHQRSFLHGYPPEVIGLLLGNCSTLSVKQCIQTNEALIKEFLADKSAAFLALDR